MNKALLIFAKQPLPGKVKTRLSPPFSLQEAANIYCCMLSDTLAKLADLPGIEKFLFFEPSCGAADYFRRNFPEIKSFPQQGDGLGDRLEKAFETVFALGFESAAAIGTDSPDLPLTLLQEPFRLLEEGLADVVFGPAMDGGYYLVALAGPCPGLFHKIPWSTKDVLTRSLVAATAIGLRVENLPVWHDMDTVQDLKRFLAGGDSACAPLT
ncbi:MAG: TIGR04282 family arsenosugar biosynthesis glycosyltransferase, partial [Geobacteraceae bacterium]